MSDSTPDGSADAGPSLRREGRATLDAQLEAVAALDRKAFRLLQFTTALASAVVAALALAPATGTGPGDANAVVANPYAAAGVGFLLLAALTAVAAYAATPRVVGVDAAGLERGLDLSGRDRTAALVRGYADWIRYNDAVNRRAALAVTVTALFVAGGTVGLALAVLRAFVGPLSPLVPLLALLALVATAAASGVSRQVRHVLGDDAGVRPRPPEGALSPQSTGSGEPRSPAPDRLGGQRVGPDSDRRGRDDATAMTESTDGGRAGGGGDRG